MYSTVLFYNTLLTELTILFIILPENMQMEDPRKQWQIEQEKMVKDYLMVSQNNLQVCQTCVFVYKYCLYSNHSSNEHTPILP